MAAAQNTNGGTTVSFTNTPQAKDDNYLSALTGISEESSGIFVFDVMANDLGGNAKSLWSVDNGVNNTGAMSGYVAADLLTQDAGRAEAVSLDTSLNGAKIWITADGKVAYDASTLSASFKARLQALGAGEDATDSFLYAIRLGNGTLSWATATIHFAGQNDGPVIVAGSTVASGAVTELADNSPGENATALSAAGTIAFSDADTNDVHSANAAFVGAVWRRADQSTQALGGDLGALALGSVNQSANTVGWSYVVSDAALDFLAVGETVTITYNVSISDGHGGLITQPVTVTLSGSNDAPLITAETGDSAGQSLAETNAALSASGTLTVSDVDVSDIVTASVLGVATSGPTGGLSNTALLSMLTVTQGPLDSAASTSGQLTWSFNSGSQAFNFLAVGETLTLSYTIRPEDSHNAPAIGDGVVTITIAGSNDAPVIVGGQAAGFVSEDAPVSVISGQLNAVDPDNGARLTWSVAGGTSSANADYHFRMDRFDIVKNGNAFFSDSFSDGAPPPNSPSTATNSGYGGIGSFSESGGELYLDSQNAGSFVGVGTPDPIIGQSAILRTNISSTTPNNGLRRNSTFNVSGVFDLTLPDSPRETYGIRLSDRLIGASSSDPGFPADQAGDNVLELAVRQLRDGRNAVQFRLIDFLHDTTTPIQTILLAPPAGADQIRLHLDHSTAGSDVINASFDYLSGGNVIGVQTFSNVGHVFQNEDWVRAEIVADAPAQSDSLLSGSYGTMTIGQSGAWTYTLDNSRAATQNLAANQHATDTFVVEVADEFGATDARTITIDVVGTNDGPIMQTSAASRTIAEDGASPNLTATGLAQFSDVDLLDTHTAGATLKAATLSTGVLPAGLTALLNAGMTASLFDASTGDGHGQLAWNFQLANAATQFLAQGQTLTAVYDVTATDNNGASATQAVTIVITGTNDAPVITAESGDSAGQNLIESNVGLTAGGTLTATDLDVSDLVTASVYSVSATGQTGGLSNAALLSMLTVTQGPLDSASTTSGPLAWNFNSGAQAFDFLADGETLTLSYTIRPDDGHNPPSIGDGVVTITITGTNDAPAIIDGPVSADVKEDVQTLAQGHLTAVDPDIGDLLSWRVQGGSLPQAADYTFAIDNLSIVKNNSLFFEDNFNDGVPPPSSPNFIGSGTPTTYGLTGTFTESGGRAILDSDNAALAIGVGTTDPLVGNLAKVRSDINPADLSRGLKSDDTFVVEGRFDLILPDANREYYGIRLSDRLVGGNGVPPDQPGDDVIEWIVQQGRDGVDRIRLREVDFAADTITNIGAFTLNAPAGADQIVLRLTHAANTGVVTASYDYLAAGVVVGSQTLAQTARIFGTETPGDVSDDENWTRVDVMAFSPQIIASNLAGAYGTLSIEQNGDWTYALANGSVAVQQLAEGQTAVDTFTVQVTDELGASDVETISVIVTGTNDAPDVTTAAVQRSLAEDSASLLQATGLGVFTDVDLIDTHSVSATLLSSSLSTGGAVSSGLATQLASALSVALTDLATGDGAGAYQWNFALNNASVQFLGAGQSMTATYAVAVKDNNGASDTQNVTVVIAGQDDAPFISASAPSNDLTEAGGNVVGVATATVNLLIGDVDSIASYDTTGWTQADATHFLKTGVYGSVQLNTSANTLTYTLDNNDPDTNGLSTGQTAADAFSVIVKENNGSLTGAANVSFTIHGTTDKTTHLIDFNNTASGAIPDGYAGFVWDANNSPYWSDNTAVDLYGGVPGIFNDGTGVAWTGFAGQNSIISSTFGAFDLLSLDLYNDNRAGMGANNVTLSAYRNGSLVNQTSSALSAQGSTMNLNWTNIDQLHIDSYGGSFQGSGWWGLDNLKVAY